MPHPDPIPQSCAQRPDAKPPLRLVFWELTARCNLKCVHCRRLDVDDLAAKDEFSPTAALDFIDQVAACGHPILILSGGEPLARADVFDLARRGSAQGLIVSLATNGTLIDEAMADRIAACGIRRVAISVDGADAKTHDQFRGIPGALEAALAGFRRLKARGMSLQFNCTVTSHNLRQRQAVYDLARREGADALHFFVLVPVGCGLEIAASHRLSAAEVEDFLHWLAERSVEDQLQLKATCAPQYFRIRKQKGVALTAGHGDAGTRGRGAGGPGHPGGAPESLAAMTRGCLAGSGVCFVSNRGEVFPCGYLPLSAGNVHQMPLREIWETSAVLAQFRTADLLEGKCGACGYRRICAGCRARAYGLSGNALAEDPYCAYQPGDLKT